MSERDRKYEIFAIDIWNFKNQESSIIFIEIEIPEFMEVLNDETTNDLEEPTLAILVLGNLRYWKL